ncbi:MAG TPA: 4-hydroxybutyrate--acetyl-CoA CoA transferase [Verrucomicrobia bacterium]|nr:4-hydroxybutyrate--acetyl-CoA CoA transferase [Verrucomicrobiota bacterium]
MTCTNYDDVYKNRLRMVQEAALQVRSGDTIVVATGIAEPPALLDAIAARVRADELRDITVYSFNPQAHLVRTLYSPDVCDGVQANAWFVSQGIRGAVKVGLVHYVPSYFHQVPRLLRENMKVDVVVSAVSPMDRAGFCSFGNAGYISVAARLCRTLLLEVNEHMPRVFGDTLVHVSEATGIVENHVPLMTAKIAPPRAEDTEIGRLIAAQIQDGATLQLGLGNLPNAVARSLLDHANLGIHSELMVTGLIDLVRAGVANGCRKNVNPRKHVFTLINGTREALDFMHDNPSMESRCSEDVMDPCLIARNDNMVAVNAILEVDLTGQCNAESLDGSQVSGTGGQLDFVRGAYQSRGGKSILAFYSTARQGSVSRVVPRLPAGAVVTTPRMDVHYLVTEYGMVNLKGCTSRERALAIISIAHPAFRDDLLREAEGMGLF